MKLLNDFTLLIECIAQKNWPHAQCSKAELEEKYHNAIARAASTWNPQKGGLLPWIYTAFLETTKELAKTSVLFPEQDDDKDFLLSKVFLKEELEKDYQEELKENQTEDFAKFLSLYLKTKSSCAESEIKSFEESVKEIEKFKRLLQIKRLDNEQHRRVCAALYELQTFQNIINQIMAEKLAKRT